jgi:hypothetical protein
LKDFHQQLRASAAALYETQIAPFAKDVDEKPRFPEEALAALNGAGYNAIHVPEAFGGQGADSVATCIVIEEVARDRHRPNPKATSKSATANGCTRLDRRLELVTHQCALRRRDLYVYLRLHRLQPIANVNCSQPRERRANRPQDQIPERAGRRGWRTGVTAWSPQPRSSP